MGGDGGVVASNRRYMRGAGTADHTGDLKRHAAEKVKFNAHEVMTTCALTKLPLYASASYNNNNDDAVDHKTNTCSAKIVSDLHGQLYHKEAAVKALLQRKHQHQKELIGPTAMAASTIGPQVRRLSDLYDVRFHFEDQRKIVSSSRSVHMPICPITGKSLTGHIPAILLCCTSGISSASSLASPNVVSESALSQLSLDELQGEFGTVTRKIRLAPPPSILEKIKADVQKEHEKDNFERMDKKKKISKKISKKKGKGQKHKVDYTKKRSNRRHHGERNSGSNDKDPTRIGFVKTSSKSTVGQEIQSRVESAIKRNSVLSSIFTKKDSSSNITEKEKKDNLFAR